MPTPRQKTGFNLNDMRVQALMVLAKAKDLGWPRKGGALTQGELQTPLAALHSERGGEPPVEFGQALSVLVEGVLLAEGLARVVDEGDGGGKRFRITQKGSAELARAMVEGIGVPPSAPPRITGRTLEESIVKPALYTLALHEVNKGEPMSMTALRSELASVIPKSEEDVSGLRNRNDRRIDQIIRNLISHDTLAKRGWIRRVPEAPAREHRPQPMRITRKGLAALAPSLIRALPDPPGFREDAADKGTPRAPRRRGP